MYIDQKQIEDWSCKTLYLSLEKYKLYENSVGKSLNQK